MMGIIENNARIIEKRLAAGMAKLREHHTVKERAIDHILANPSIGGRRHHARSFEIEGVGNLLTMTVTEAEENQLGSFVITPYFKDLPLFSSDYVYSGKQRFFLIEIYDLAVQRGDIYERGLHRFADYAKAWEDMPDFPVRPCWYDDIRPVCIAKAPSVDQDELAVERFLAALDTFIDLEQKTPAFSEALRKEKWRINKAYADRLIDEGGVSTDLFTEAIGAENTRRFFDEVFFGCAYYSQ